MQDASGGGMSKQQDGCRAAMRMRSNGKATLEIIPYDTDETRLYALGTRQLVMGAVLGVVLACCASMSLAPVDSNDVFAFVKDATGAGYIVLEVLCGLPARDACLVSVALGALLARPCYRVFLAHGRHRRAAMPSPGFAAAWVLPMLFAATMAFGQSFDGCRRETFPEGKFGLYFQKF